MILVIINFIINLVLCFNSVPMTNKLKQNISNKEDPKEKQTTFNVLVFFVSKTMIGLKFMRDASDVISFAYLYFFVSK